MTIGFKFVSAAEWVEPVPPASYVAAHLRFAPTAAQRRAGEPMIPDLELDRLVAIAEAAADLAGTVIRPFFRAVPDAEMPATEIKTDNSPVTLADRRAEQAMRAMLAEHLPDHGVLGEEFGLDRPDARFRWVLDPIDGTRAFITGRPVFGTLIGLLDGGDAILGIIDQPVTGERWIGAARRPTVFRGPFGGDAGCRPCARIGDAELSCTSPDMFAPGDLAAFRLLAAAARRVSYGGDCYAYGLLALGQIDMIAEADLKIWDWTALIPIIEGAGGRVTDWSGEKLTPYSDGRVLAVGNERLLAPALALLAG